MVLLKVHSVIDNKLYFLIKFKKVVDKKCKKFYNTLIDVKKIRLAWITSEVLFRCTDSVPTTADTKYCHRKSMTALVSILTETF